MSASAYRTRYRLGPAGRFTLDVSARVLYADGQTVQLGSRAFDVLAGLVEAGGAAVSKDRLMQRAWAGLVVEEANLHVQVSALRKALAADAIDTIPALGYRWAWPAVPVAIEGPLHNLPAERSAFFGRRTLLASARSALGAGRLLTLVGIGGAGKTRLALTLGRQLLETVADGVWWVDLASLDRGDGIPAAVAKSMGIDLPDDGDGIGPLAHALQARQVLLILDNCEHLLADVARLVHGWLDAVPGLKVVATSREALAVDGEWVLPVGPMAVPTVSTSEADARSFESVQLLADRAAKVAPWMALGPADGATLAEICRRVDGIPLAIEIAAAQLRAVSAPQLLALLEERFRLLANLAHALPRQRTMQAVIEWSYDHLQPPEQELLLGLSLCIGGCDFEAARSLMGPQASAVTLTAALGRLAEQALMTLQHDAAGPPRYVLLETVSQFALDRLGAQALAASLRARFVAHFLAVAEAHDAEILRHGRGAETLDRMDRERGNLLRAIQFCTSAGSDAALTDALRLVGALRHYWVARSQLRTGLAASQSVLSLVDPARPPDRALLLALMGEAQLLAALDRSEAAVQAFGRIGHLAAAIGERTHRATALSWRATLLDRLGRAEEAQADHDLAHRLATETGDPALLADVLSRQAAQATHHGRYDEAAVLLEQVLAMRRTLGHGYRLAVALINNAVVAQRRGCWPDARHFLAEAATLLETVGSDTLDLGLIRNAGELLRRAGHWEALVSGLVAERHHRETAGAPSDPEDEALAASQLEAARAALGPEGFDAALERGRLMDLASARRLVTASLNALGGGEDISAAGAGRATNSRKAPAR